MIVTIDGPAGAGKSSAVRELARRLGFHFLDTGAMYRAVALAVRRADVDADDEHAVGNLLDSIAVEFAPGVIRLDGADVSGAIRTTMVANLSSRIAALDVVRAFMVERQRAAGANLDLVTEGRDQGTVVFPHADIKFFLVADRIERARRRHADLTLRGETVTLEEVLNAQDERDRRDSQRHTGPLVKAVDAIEIDTTALNPEQVLAVMEVHVRRCRETPLPG